MPETKSSDDVRTLPQTRVDFAHPASAINDHDDDLPLDLLQAIAGRDAQMATEQLRGQALELSAMLREKQRVLEKREAELNARSALLENDLRTARLHQFRETQSRDNETNEQPAAETDRRSDKDTSDPAVLAAEVRRRWRESLDQAPAHEEPTAEPSRPVPAADSPAKDDIPLTLPENHQQTTLDRSPDLADSLPANQQPMNAEAADDLDPQFNHLEQMRRQLRQREEKLVRRERQAEEMHDEVTALHREALELRLASEHVWSDLRDQFPSEELARSMSEIRGKLADHYRMAHDTLARRKDELHELRSELNLQEQRLRQQRRDIQMWADRRYDEVESRLAKIILRERELDQMENDFQRQSLEWQQQRESYRQEIEQLTWRLHERASN